MELPQYMKLSFQSLSTLAIFIFTLRTGAGIPNPEIRVIEPEFRPVPENVTHKGGDMARLFCTVDNLGDRTVIWRKLPEISPLTIGTDTWADDSRIHVEHVTKDNQWNLLIDDVTRLDSGTYECQVSTHQRKMRNRVRLKVIDDPVKRNPVMQVSGTQFLEKYSNMQIYCKTSTIYNGQSNVVWFKDGDTLSPASDNRIKIETYSSIQDNTVTSLLKIDQVTQSDSGLYVCRNSNRKDMTTVQVFVINGGSNNVKRAGSFDLPSCGVGLSPMDIKAVCLSIYTLILYWFVT
ncbi:myopalladin [Patella vulgata]|uniref:myopalladin n=1 Tax=Patella vulgata TaxID=6465 RepID=UPI00217F5C29|nr:myopalladin [Patella vulgata]